MDTLTLLGAVTGLGLMAGLRLYLTIFAVGFAVRMGWVDLPAHLEQLRVLSDNTVLTVAGVAAALEFLADKIPFIDSIWDTVHTFIRPAGAAWIGLNAAQAQSPVTQVVFFLLAGGIALSGHTAKAGTRVAVNHSPEPVSNVGLSFLEDGLVLGGTWLAVNHPIITLCIVIVFLVLFIWLVPKLIRLVLRQFRRVANFLVGRDHGTSNVSEPQ
jgi:hypothetical protein